ncbi:hypothetical protein [Burkholderia pyrrocinia]|uniref:hypothetical protein n=1 Tax=Burkholderia pyrrocinia TaxID=60550 RepID=UPI00158B26E2|nr:hypothetical protein [Burkholderia pyrrocinia]
MSTINLVQAVSGTFDQAVTGQLSARIGLGSDVTRHIIERGAAVVVAALMGYCATSQDCASAFSSVMSVESDARIGEQLHGLLTDSSSLKDLEAAGDALSKRAMQCRIGALSDPISSMTGVPMQAAHVLVGLSAIVMFGVLKRHLLVDQASVADFAHLLARQIPSVAPFMTDSIAHALGFANTSGFADAVETRLVAPKQASVGLPMYGHVNVPVSTTIRGASFPATMLAPRVAEQAGASTPAPAVAPTAARASAQRRKSRRGGTWMLVLLIVLIACAMAFFAYQRAHPGFFKAGIAQLGADGRDDRAIDGHSQFGAVIASVPKSNPSAPTQRRDAGPAAVGGSRAARG